MHGEPAPTPERTGYSTTLVLTLQWLAFAVTNTLPVPLVVAAAFHLSPGDAAALAGRIFLVTGAMSLAQALFGHRQAIVEGPAGMWWGVFVSLALVAPAIGLSMGDLRASLEFGMAVAGVVLILAALWRRGVERLVRLFSPAVTGALMILLPVQLTPAIASALIGSPPFLPGLLLGLATFLAVLCLALFGRGIWRSASLLVGVAGGTALWALLRLPFRTMPAGALFALPLPFAWGRPQFNVGVVIVSMLTAVLLMSNLLASLRAMQAVTGAKVTAELVRRTVMVNGLSVVVSGVFAVPGAIPYASNAGFVSLSRSARRLPFLLSAGVFVLLGMLPDVGRLVIALPLPVVYAALLASFGQLFAIGVADLMQEGLGLSRSLVVTGPILLGIGAMSVPGSTWRQFHSPLALLFGNGMIVGLLALMLLLPLARLANREKMQVPDTKTSL